MGQTFSAETLADLARLLNAPEVHLGEGNESAICYLNHANSLAVLAELLETSDEYMYEHQDLAYLYLQQACLILENSRKQLVTKYARPSVRRRSRG